MGGPAPAYAHARRALCHGGHLVAFWNRPAWGQMIADARQTIYQSPWSLVLPILCIFVTVLGFNLLGDGLRRSLDVRLTEVRRD